MDSSAKLSAFLALGCLSPRTVHAEVMRLQAAEEQSEQQQHFQQQEQQQEQSQHQGKAQLQQEQAESVGKHVAGSATSVPAPAPGWREPQRGDTWRWLLMHLAIRDFFTFTALKEGEGKPALWHACCHCCCCCAMELVRHGVVPLIVVLCALLCAAAALAAPGGIAGKPVEWRQDARLFQRWVRGQVRPSRE